MHQKHKTIVWFNEVTKKDIPLVGGKGANLGEMTNANIPVPPGFIVTADAYFEFLRQTKIVDKIRELLDEETGKPILEETEEVGGKDKKVSEEDMKKMSAFYDFINTLDLDDFDKRKS